MKDRNMIDMCENALAAFGYDRQIDQAIEEFVELLDALMRIKNKGMSPDRHYNLKEEMADVTIMMKQLQMMFEITDKDLDIMIDHKVIRTNDFIKNKDTEQVTYRQYHVRDVSDYIVGSKSSLNTNHEVR